MYSFKFLLPVPSERLHLGHDVRVEVKRENYLNCAVLCTTVLHNNMHKYVSSSYICICQFKKAFLFDFFLSWKWIRSVFSSAGNRILCANQSLLVSRPNNQPRQPDLALVFSVYLFLLIETRLVLSC